MDPLLAALKAVFDSMDVAGDEYAYEWLHEVWARIVPLDIRRAVGDTLTTGE